MARTPNRLGMDDKQATHKGSSCMTHIYVFGFLCIIRASRLRVQLGLVVYLLEHIRSRLFLNSLGFFRVGRRVILSKIWSDQKGIFSRSLKSAPVARRCEYYTVHISA